ncbi:AsmA-like C-terminal domain-containing protein [Litorimonas sp. RW-G-Af-16]|uniref:YhdP family protein n=1 Tax=Litorimonas sp. RW-G-Af-16 TaxID=3241168 RepID=UPI003AAC32FD
MPEPTDTINPEPTEIVDDVSSSPASGWRQSKAAAFFAYWAKRIGYRIFRLSGEIIAVIFGLSIAWLYAMSWLITQQSMDLAPLKPWVGQGFTQAFEGKEAEIDQMTLQWLPASNDVAFVANDVRIQDGSGQILQDFPNLSSSFTLNDLLRLRPKPKAVALEGGSLTWLIEQDGTFVIGLGTPETVGRFGPSVRGPQETAGQDINLPEGFEALSIRAGKVYIVDRIRGLDLALDVSQLDVSVKGDQIKLDLISQLQQIDKPALLNIIASSNVALTDYKIAVQGENVRLDQIAPTIGRYSDLRRLEASIDLVAEAEISDSRNLETALLDVTIGKGQINGFASPLALGGFEFEGLLRPGAQILDIANISVDTERLRFNGAGNLSELGAINDGDINSSPLFNLRLKNARIDATPIFAAPFETNRIETIGRLDFDARTLALSRFAATQNGYTIDLSADANFTESYGLKMLAGQGKVGGVFKPSDLVNLWPVSFADGARNWIGRAVLDGQLENVNFKLNLDEAFFAAPALTPERLSLDFDVVDGDVRYISTMTPLMGVSGKGQIRGNALSLDYAGGQVGGLSVIDGRINIPQLMPKGGDIIIAVNGRGKASDMMGLINQKPFQFADRYGVDTNQIGGQGQISAKITRPLLVFFDQNRISYEVTGDFTDAVAPFKLGVHPIHKGQVKLTADRNSVQIFGPAQIGPWPAQIAWQEYLGDDPRPTSYQVDGVMTRDTLDDFGFGFREFFDGKVKVDIDAYGGEAVNVGQLGLGIATGTLNMDFEDAELTIGEIWSKAAGEDGSLTTNITRLGENDYRFSNVKAQAPGLLLDGTLDLASNLRLINLDMQRVKVDGLVDAAVQLKPNTEKQRLSLFIEGDYVDASPWTNVALQSRSAGLDVPLLMTASVDNLVLRPTYKLADARVLFTHTGKSVSDFRLIGQVENGPVRAELTTNTDDGNRMMTLSVPQASDAVETFLGLTTTQGGQLEIRTKLPPIDVEGPMIGQAVVTDFKLQRIPFLTQILSLASLTGMVDMLSGEGVWFERFEVPFTLTETDIQVRDARLFGPVLGMTGDGDISLENRTVDFDGTLVPAYTANSLLGDIPVIGDIFVGKKGSGVFALSYDVTGSFDKAQISVNPLSALTPGFLKGIFKSDREKLSDDVLAEIEAVKPKEGDEN